jgi:hypothetical protein
MAEIAARPRSPISATTDRDHRSRLQLIEITDLGYNCGAFLRFLFGNRSSAMGNSKVLVTDKKTRQNVFDHITLRLVTET